MRKMTRFVLGIILLSNLTISGWAADAAKPADADVTPPPACKIIKKSDGTYTCPDNSRSGRWRIGTGASTCTQQLKPTKLDEVCSQVWGPADWAGRSGF
jgi:hypothetical protein